MTVEHKFGGRHTEIKLNVVQRYLEAYLLVMSRQNYRSIYVDAFAGTGERTTTHNGLPLLGEISDGRIITPGSAQLVLQMENNFDEYLFIDKKAKHVEALEKLCARFPDKKTVCRKGDANELVQEFCRSTNWKREGEYWGTRAVLFLDPYGMQVEWQTLKDIAATKAIDLWFLFPLSGLYRQATRSWDSIDDDKINAIDRCLGTPDWREALYEATSQTDLFADNDRLERNANIPAIEAYVKQRLQAEFTGWVSEPIPLRNTKGPQLFSLFFAMSNPSKPAKNIAQKIVRHLRKSIT